VALPAKRTQELLPAYTPAECERVALQLARQFESPLIRWWQDPQDPYRLWLEVHSIRRGAPAVLRLTATLSVKHSEQTNSSKMI